MISERSNKKNQKKKKKANWSFTGGHLHTDVSDFCNEILYKYFLSMIGCILILRRWWLITYFFINIFSKINWKYCGCIRTCCQKRLSAGIKSSWICICMFVYVCCTNFSLVFWFSSYSLYKTLFRQNRVHVIENVLVVSVMVLLFIVHKRNNDQLLNMKQWSSQW